MIDFATLGKPRTSKYSSRQEEIDGEFADSANWIGIEMDITEIRPFVWCKNKKETHQTIINADKYNVSRVEAITSKIQRCSWINKKQIQIL